LKDVDVNLTDQEISEMIEAVDLDGDGQINFEEYKELNAMMNYSDVEDSDEEISDDEEMFKKYDIDGDGFITHDELKKFVLKRHNSVTDFEISKMIKQFDIDGDGKISYEEYQTMMLQSDHSDKEKSDVACGGN